MIQAMHFPDGDGAHIHRTLAMMEGIAHLGTALWRHSLPIWRILSQGSWTPCRLSFHGIHFLARPPNTGRWTQRSHLLNEGVQIRLLFWDESRGRILGIRPGCTFECGPSLARRSISPLVKFMRIACVISSRLCPVARTSASISLAALFMPTSEDATICTWGPFTEVPCDIVHVRPNDILERDHCMFYLQSSVDSRTFPIAAGLYPDMPSSIVICRKSDIPSDADYLFYQYQGR